jgi:triosephosphate isomerase
MRPIVVVNAKNYEKSTGINAVRLAKKAQKIAKEHNADIRICVSALDLAAVCKAVKIPVYIEHVDPIEHGRHTGFILPALVKKYGAYGTLINHSEHRIPQKQIAQTVTLCKKHKLRYIICAKNSKEAKLLDKFQPEFVAVEPPKLIGGNISVSTAEPKLITDSVKAVRKGKLLVGAGVKTSDDVRIALKLKAKGVLVASGVAKAPCQTKAIKKLSLL